MLSLGTRSDEIEGRQPKNINTSYAMLSTIMTNRVIFTKKVTKSGAGLLIWIPKDIETLMGLKASDVVHIQLTNLTPGDPSSE